MIFRRCAVLVSALTVVAAFLAAPYEHVHTTTALRHAHVTPHTAEHQHGSPDSPDQTPHEHEDVLGTSAFLSSGPAATASVDGVLVSPVTVTDPERAPHDEDVGEPRAHGPPTGPRSARAPPVLPAF